MKMLTTNLALISLLTLVLLLHCSQSSAETAKPNYRSALLIANGNYQHLAKLKGPKQEAKYLATKLKKQGFNYVKTHLNLDERSLKKAVKTFARRVKKKGGLAVVYFSGHGMNYISDNYLVPIDLPEISPEALKKKGLNLAALVQKLQRKNGENYLFLNACRDPLNEETTLRARQCLYQPHELEGAQIVALPYTIGRISEETGRRLVDQLMEQLSGALQHKREISCWGVSIQKPQYYPQGGHSNYYRKLRKLRLGTISPVKARKWPQEDMVRVPAGPFLSGCDPKQSGVQCLPNDKPRTQPSLSSFAIDKTEVTVKTYTACVKAGACSKPSGGAHCNYRKRDRKQHPVNCVDWNQAKMYCSWRGKRLPTGLEWEKAARGTGGALYPWGNQPLDCEHAVLSLSSPKSALKGDQRDGCGSNSTWPVGSKPKGKSPYGALDMMGNTWEWVADTQAENGKCRTYAAGESWYIQTNFSISRPLQLLPEADYDYLGFRCAVDLVE